MYIKTIFTTDGFAPAYLGYYIQGQDWNGWEYAHFTHTEGMKIMEEYNKNAERPMMYDPIYDQFYLWDEGIEDYYIIKGYDIPTAEGIQHLYGIGAGCWTWYRISAEGIRYVAQEVEEFIYYKHSYHYWDEYDNRRDDVVNYLLEEFKNLSVLVQVMNIMRNEELKADERFAKLKGILNL